MAITLGTELEQARAALAARSAAELADFILSLGSIAGTMTLALRSYSPAR
jgi:hypothetical protein